MTDAHATPTVLPNETNVLWTTRRGLATASFCLGFWGSLTFWWYPFGLAIASIALVLGLLAVLMGWRSGEKGFHLAWLGILFGATGQGLAIGAYRFAQLSMEGTPPPILQMIWPF